MANTIMVCGYGPAISEAVARKFGAEGFQVGLVARRAEVLARGEAGLKAAGVRVQTFVRDLSDPEAIQHLFGEARAALGPTTVLHWNAFSTGAGDLTTHTASDLRTSLDVSVIGLVAATQAALSDLRSARGSAAILVTGGRLAMYEPEVDSAAVKFGAMGLAVAKAAQHKLVGVLHAKLKPDGIYVGEVTVGGFVKGSASDRGQATLDPNEIAQRFWSLYKERNEIWSAFP
jgi:short-subunit dehydrogenase